ncbi:hypothetical protein SEA_KEANU_55 [Streptomyces phage Keanu]|nr:hypothetical protein SEA_KEANU_55 [Streptomyces phage Keanu]
MKHEALPHSEHAEVNERFWPIIVPQINFPAFRAMNTMLKEGTLRQSSAARLEQDLWSDGSLFDDTNRNWRVKPVD